jgi:hypothetical protein
MTVSHPYEYAICSYDEQMMSKNCLKCIHSRRVISNIHEILWSGVKYTHAGDLCIVSISERERKKILVVGGGVVVKKCKGMKKKWRERGDETEEE